MLCRWWSLECLLSTTIVVLHQANFSHVCNDTIIAIHGVWELNFNKITCQIYTFFWYCVTKSQAKRIFFLKLAFFLKFELLHGVTKMASSTNGWANYHWWVLFRQWSRRYIRLSQLKVFNFLNRWDMFFDPIVWLGDFGEKIVYDTI